MWCVGSSRKGYLASQNTRSVLAGAIFEVLCGRRLRVHVGHFGAAKVAEEEEEEK